MNGKSLKGLFHEDVVRSLRELPEEVCIVCARKATGPSPLRGTIVDNVDPGRSKLAFASRVTALFISRHFISDISFSYLFFSISISTFLFWLLFWHFIQKSYFWHFISRLLIFDVSFSTFHFLSFLAFCIFNCYCIWFQCLKVYLLE